MPRRSTTAITVVKIEEQVDGVEDGTKLEKNTPFRRSARSSASATASITPLGTPTTGTSLNLSSYAYQPTAGPSTPRKRIKIEQSDPADLLVPLSPMKTDEDVKPPPTPRSSSKKTLPLQRLERAHPAPAKWEVQYNLIERMRRGIIAPVDDMGCERPRTTADVDPKTLRFHILISLMLSSQTKDAVTSQAIDQLHRALPGGLTAESLAAASVEMVHECINKVGFWRRKTEYIQAAARHLLDQEGELRGDVPNTIEGLCELKGVGPKMAFLCLQCAWDINAGIGVDVHVHRITNRLKWHKPPTQTPEQTRINLESWLPPHLHKPINPMLVGFGQVVCLPVGPRCDICLLGKQKLCPSRVSNVKAEGRKEVVYTFTDGDGDERAKVEVKYEGGMRSKDEDLVKIEPSEGVEGMTRVEQVLDVLDQVDGTKDIGS